jgi:predicted enzyme related to lactoylglutathione lyase
VDSTCSQAQGLGARVVKPPADIPNVGRFAVLSDPQGATFAVFTPGGGPPPGTPPVQGGFSWHELATTDVAAALRFYGQLFGWTKGPGHDMGAMGIYQLFEHGGTQAGGICNVQGPSTAPSWLSYVHIADSGRAVAAAKAAGGRLLHGPMEVPGGSWIAMMMDPQGGAFAVQEAPRAAQSKPAAAKSARAAKSPAAAKLAAAPAKPAAAASAAPAAAAVKRAVGARVAKRAKKGGRKVRRTARKTARKVRRTGRKAARRAARPGVRRAVRKAARKTARAVRRGGRRVARRARVAGRRVRRAARRRR